MPTTPPISTRRFSHARDLEAKLDRRAPKIASAVVEEVMVAPWVDGAIDALATERLDPERLVLARGLDVRLGRIVSPERRLRLEKDPKKDWTYVKDGNGKTLRVVELIDANARLEDLNLFAGRGGTDLGREVDRGVERALEPLLALGKLASRPERLKLGLGVLTPEAVVARTDDRRARLQPAIDRVGRQATAAAELEARRRLVDRLADRIESRTEALEAALARRSRPEAHTVAELAPEVAERHRLTDLPPVRGLKPTRDDRAIVAEVRPHAVLEWQTGRPGLVRGPTGLARADRVDYGGRHIESNGDQTIVTQTRGDQVASIVAEARAWPAELVADLGSARVERLIAAGEAYRRAFARASEVAPALAEAIGAAGPHLALVQLLGIAGRLAAELDPERTAYEALDEARTPEVGPTEAADRALLLVDALLVDGADALRRLAGSELAPHAEALGRALGVEASRRERRHRELEALVALDRYAEAIAAGERPRPPKARALAPLGEGSEVPLSHPIGLLVEPYLTRIEATNDLVVAAMEVARGPEGADRRRALRRALARAAAELAPFAELFARLPRLGAELDRRCGGPVSRHRPALEAFLAEL